MKKKKTREWLPVREYAKRVGKSKQQIYLDIRLGKIPSKNVCEKEISVIRKQILWEGGCTQ